jgi:hypothetical protein
MLLMLVVDDVVYFHDWFLL